MSIFASIVCTIGILNSFCITSAQEAVTLKTFEDAIMSIKPIDGTKIVFSRTDVMFKNAADIPIFKAADDDIAEYLGMHDQQDICVIEMKNNVTDFDTWIWNDMEVQPNGEYLVDMDTVFAEANLKEFKQSGKMNRQLQLVEKQDIFENDLNMIVFFKNESEAIALSKLVHNFAHSKSCWNVLQADPPRGVTKIPSIGITLPKVFGREHVSILTLPASEYSLNMFVNANIKELEMKLQNK
tara:strand:+ start:704 stop:1423 length:720 start_codon:yes stop_codon:yes gene_type:complete